MLLFAMGPDADFATFWDAYPRKCGKLLAQKAYQKARKLASAADILAGVERYKRRKPAYADWAHPSSWLNAGRWMDEDDAPKSTRNEVDSWEHCTHTPHCHNAAWHVVVLARERGEVV